MKHQFEDYQITENCISIYCDNTADICLSKNHILHSRAKHIEIKHHFIKDYVQKGVLDIQFNDTDISGLIYLPNLLLLKDSIL